MDNNWKELMSIIDKHFEGEQKENILKLHTDFEMNTKTAEIKVGQIITIVSRWLLDILHVIKFTHD